jgi:GNAT superfamily N-acetyltransferase
MKTIDILQLQPTQIDRASEIAAAAFAEDPMFGYLIPKDSQRLPALTWLMGKAISYSTQYGHTHTTPDLQGIAAWLPPGGFSLHPRQLWQMFWQLQLYALPWQVGWSNLGRWLDVLAATERAHQRDMGDSPHWYLGIMVVHPASQGQGVGSRLLEPVLQRAKDEGLPCYLVTFTEPAVRFYLKNGFKILRREQPAANAPPFWTLQYDVQ